MVNEELEQLTQQTLAVPDAELLQSRLVIVRKVQKELTPRRVTEHQTIFRDAIKTSRELPLSGLGDNSVEYSISEKNALRITGATSRPAGISNWRRLDL